MNQQLVDYIKQQLQLGVSQEGIKNTLVTSGWPEADVAAAISSLETKPSTSAAAGSAPAASPVTSDIFPKSAESVSVKPDPAKKSEPAPIEPKAESNAATPASVTLPSIKHEMMVPVVLAVVALLLIVSGAYLYMEKSALNEDVATVNQANIDLIREKEALVQEKNGMTSQLAMFMDENDSLRAHLTFLLGSGTTTVRTNLAGTLRGDDKMPYTLVTSSGLVVNIRNYKDARVSPLIKNLLNSEAQLTLEHLPGSRDAIIVAVNGAQVPMEDPAASAPLSVERPIIP